MRCSLVPSYVFGMERLHSNRPIVHTSYDLVHYRPITCAEDFVPVADLNMKY